MKRAAVFLDRDGVINRKRADGGYVTRWEDVEFIPGAAKAIELLNRYGYQVIVVTNQRCVAIGLITNVELEAIHRRMCRELAAVGAVIDRVYYCPHGVLPPCNCRKPRPGMLLEAALSGNFNLTSSWMIGDSDTDIEAGRSAGCKTALVLGDARESKVSADIFAASLLDATRQIIESGTDCSMSEKQASVERVIPDHDVQRG
jgi:D-glycero-D-manno-heptose 1,7-bisphosphate phosphatase